MPIDSPTEEQLLSLIRSLKDLEEKIHPKNTFNIFSIFGLETNEIRHSRFLAFLLSPYEHHGLGSEFLRTFLMSCLNEHPNPPISRLQIALADLDGARVYCERNRFDISIEIPKISENQTLLLVIENKIYSTERRNQLSDYRKYVQEHYHNFLFMGCYLTPYGIDGSDSEWAPLSYYQIIENLKGTLSTRQVPGYSKNIINDYIRILEEKIVTSTELVEACKRIYAENRNAFNLVLEHGYASTLTTAFDLFQDALRTTHNVEIKRCSTKSRLISFLPQSWEEAKNFPRADDQRWHNEVPLVMWFSLSEDKLFFVLEVGPFRPIDSQDTLKIRTDFIENVRKELNDSNNRKIKDTYTRIISKSKRLKQDENAQDLSDLMLQLWKETEDKIGKISDKISNFQCNRTATS